MVASAAIMVSCSNDGDLEVSSKSLVGVWKESKIIHYNKQDDGTWVVEYEREITRDAYNLVLFADGRAIELPANESYDPDEDIDYYWLLKGNRIYWTNTKGKIDEPDDYDVIYQVSSTELVLAEEFDARKYVIYYIKVSDKP